MLFYIILAYIWKRPKRNLEDEENTTFKDDSRTVFSIPDRTGRGIPIGIILYKTCIRSTACPVKLRDVHWQP